MSGMIGYALGYDAGRSDEQTANHRREVVHQIFTATGLSPSISRISIGFTRRWLTRAAPQFIITTPAISGKQKAQQFKNEALYWRDEKYAPVRAKAKARREENAALQAQNTALRNEIAALRDENTVLLARLQERNPDLAEEQAAHDETFKERQSLHRFRVIAASLIDALLAGRANRPEFAELLNLAKTAADTIERGDLFTAFRDEPEKNNRLCRLADALQKP